MDMADTVSDSERVSSTEPHILCYYPGTSAVVRVGSSRWTRRAAHHVENTSGGTTRESET